MTFDDRFPMFKKVMKVILAVESVFVSDKDLAQRGPEHTPWKTRQPVRTRVKIGDDASGSRHAAVRADGCPGAKD